MKKILMVFGFLLCVGFVNAQSKDNIQDAKRDANRELNNGIRTGRNAGDQQKVNDAKEAKEKVRNAQSSGEVRQHVKEYRAGGNNTPGKPVSRDPASTKTAQKAY